MGELELDNLGVILLQKTGFPGGAAVKNPPAVQETGLIPGLGRAPGEGNGYPLQYSFLENPINRGAWWLTVHRDTKSWT